MTARVLVFSATTEAGSPSHRLALEAARQLALTPADLALASLADYPLPLLDSQAPPTLPVPREAEHLAARFADQDAVLFVSPQAHGAVPAVAKNAVEWIERAAAAFPRRHPPLRDLLVGLASIGEDGQNAARALDSWRHVFLSLGAEPFGRGFCLEKGSSAFDAGGRLRDETAAAALEALLAGLLDRAGRIGRRPS